MAKNKQGSGELRHVWLRYSHMGFEFALTFGLLVLVGYWLGGYWSIRPFGILVGAFLGFALALYQLIKSARQMEQEIAQAEKDEEASSTKEKSGGRGDFSSAKGPQNGTTEESDKKD